MGTGAWVNNKIDVPGSDLALSGLDFLYGVSTGNSKAPGRKVVVIGGGNVAIDVALTAKRLGAEHVAMVCLERLEEMPAWDYEIAQAKEEGVEILNSYGPKQILSQGTSVCGIELKKCPQVFDENGKFSPVYDENDTHTLDADCVILAIGQRTQPEFFQDATEHNGRTILVGKETGNTRGNIYAGGDVVQGPSTVVQAIADGRKAADAMYIKLGGMLRRDSVQSRMPINPDSFTQKQAEKIQMLPLEKRSVELEDALGLAVQEVYEEAKRCFHCGCVAVSPSDLAPALLVLDAEIETNTRVIPAGQFFAPVVGGSTVLEKGEFVLSIRLDKSHGGTYQRYVKHRVRKSLDFPVVSLACNMTIENGIVTDAKLAYGAVYAVPIRLYEVEELIKGKKLTPELTVKAADLAVKGAQPLEENSYKVNIARALVRRTLAGAMES